MKRLIAVSTIIAISACSNFQSIESTSGQLTVAGQTHNQASNSVQLEQLNATFENYKGVPYRYGGMDRRGFDCSGFINVAYREAFNVALPRTTEELATAGIPVRRDQLKTGDIVFFKTSVKQLHAGIYTEDGYFIHASTSKGVIRSSLKNQYWLHNYIKARRLL